MTQAETGLPNPRIGNRAADKGMRLDHLLLSPNIAHRLTAGGVDDWTRDEAGASDHAPAWITLKS